MRDEGEDRVGDVSGGKCEGVVVRVRIFFSLLISLILEYFAFINIFLV